MRLPTIDDGWTLFLDRDGVINERIIGGYVSSIEEFHFLPGALECISRASSVFSRIIVVTNQQGIGKGLMTEADLAEVHRHLSKEVEKSGGKIDAIFHAPQLHEANSPLRKPDVGMGLLAQEQFPDITFSKSIMVGDSLTDMQFGHRLGMFCVKIGSEITAHEAIDITCASLGQFGSFLQ